MCQVIGPDAGQVACLDVMISTGAARSYVVLRGELDLTTAPRLEQLLGRLRREGNRQIIVDLSGVEFLSAAGLTVLLRAEQALCALGGRLVLTRPTCIVCRVLAITGLDATLNIQDITWEEGSMAERVELGGAK
jgi:stage II sporulation protein AA (anti-sigma F factor antagonist)